MNVKGFQSPKDAQNAGNTKVLTRILKRKWVAGQILK